MHRVNYDEIAHLYDESARDHDVDTNLLEFLDSHPEIAPAQARILDVGCGTGKQLHANRTPFPTMFMVGLDRFHEMVRIARNRCPGVAWVHGDGTALPFSSGSFHYVSSQFSYSHVPDKKKLLAEIFRVLRPCGRFAMTHIDPWSMENWNVYRYFPAARDLDYRDFVPVESFVTLMEAAGFQMICAQRSRRRQREDLRDFLAYASQRQRASQLIAISDEEYVSGIGRLERAIAQARDRTAVVEHEMCFVTIAGDKPGSGG